MHRFAHLRWNRQSRLGYPSSYPQSRVQWSLCQSTYRSTTTREGCESSNALVTLDLKTDRFSQRNVVSPRGVGNPNLLWARVELAEETSCDTESTSSRNGLSDRNLHSISSAAWILLHNAYSTFLEGFAVFTVGKLSGQPHELGVTLGMSAVNNKRQ